MPCGESWPHSYRSLKILHMAAEISVLGLVHLGICSLGANDKVEWVEVETGNRMENSALIDESSSCPRTTLHFPH